MEHRYKFRILPTLQQEQIIEDTFSGCAYLYNYFLTQQLERLRDSSPMDYYECSAHLQKLLGEKEWMHALDPEALRDVVRECVRDVHRYLQAQASGRPAELPKPRSHTDIRRSYRITTDSDAVIIGDGVVQIPVLGTVASTVSRTTPLKVVSASIMQGFNTYYELAVHCTTRDRMADRSLAICVGYFSPAEYMDRLRIRRRNETEGGGVK